MWHGTQPFGGDAMRLSIAFDLLPAQTLHLALQPLRAAPH
jgi:hypothetical protein